MDHTQFSETLIGSGHTQVVLQKRPECFLADKHTCVAILSLVNAALGAGVLAYPFAYMSAGMVLASVFTTAIGFLSMVSLCIIMHSMTVLQQREGMAAIRSFGDMIKYGLGARASNALEALIVVYMFGACVGYLTVLENVFDGVVSDAQLKHLGFTSRHEADVLCICAASVVCFALATLRSIEALKYSAAAAVLAVLFTVGTLVYQAFADPCLPPLANATATQQRAQQKARRILNGALVRLGVLDETKRRVEAAAAAARATAPRGVLEAQQHHKAHVELSQAQQRRIEW